MKLLVPVDGSLASKNALIKAFEIAKNYDFSVKLISVYNDKKARSYLRNERQWRQADGSIISGLDMPLNYDEAKHKKHIETVFLLESLIGDFELNHIQVETLAVSGEPYEVILETAEKENFDLLVMGNRGFSKLKRFFIGSTAQKVISEAKCPVLVIHTDAED